MQCVHIGHNQLSVVKNRCVWDNINKENVLEGTAVPRWGAWGKRAGLGFFWQSRDSSINYSNLEGFKICRAVEHQGNSCHRYRV